MKLETNKENFIKWKPEEVDFIFRNFQIFEEKMVGILQTLPLTKENELSWSPELVNLFLDASSLIDSISRWIVGHGKGGEEKVIIKNSNKLKKVKKLDIKDFEDNLFSNIRMLDSRVVVYVYPLKIIFPYRGYLNNNGWWKIYNSLKHNRIINYNKANLINTLEALSGLFLLLVRYKHEEFTKALMRFGWIKTGVVPEYVHQDRSDSPFNYWYDSQIFGVSELVEFIPSDDVSQIQCNSGSKKLRTFVGRFN